MCRTMLVARQHNSDHGSQNRPEPDGSVHAKPDQWRTETVPAEKMAHAGAGEEREKNRGRERDGEGEADGPLRKPTAALCGRRRVEEATTAQFVQWSCRNERERERGKRPSEMGGRDNREAVGDLWVAVVAVGRQKRWASAVFKREDEE